MKTPRTRSQTRSREVIYIYELAREHEDDIVEDIAFEDCSIIGPVVLIVLDDVSLVGNHFQSPHVVWPPLDAERPYFGAIGVQRCDFRNCRFERVGLAGPKRFTEMFLAQVGGEPPANPVS